MLEWKKALFINSCITYALGKMVSIDWSYLVCSRASRWKKTMNYIRRIGLEHCITNPILSVRFPSSKGGSQEIGWRKQHGWFNISIFCFLSFSSSAPNITNPKPPISRTLTWMQKISSCKFWDVDCRFSFQTTAKQPTNHQLMCGENSSKM